MKTASWIRQSSIDVGIEDGVVADGVSPQTKIAQSLAQRIRQMETAGRHQHVGSISSGCQAIDEKLPEGGYAKGSMVEFLQSKVGSGATSLAFMTAKQAMKGGKYLLVVDSDRHFYPPAARSLGIPLERMIVIHPKERGDMMWSIDQALRCSGIAAVVSKIDRLDDREARRWQLAAEQGGALGLWVRDYRTARGQPSWSDIQWRIEPQPAPKDAGGDNRRWLKMSLLRCRSGVGGASFSVYLDGRDASLHLSDEQHRKSGNHTELSAYLATRSVRKRSQKQPA